MTNRTAVPCNGCTACCKLDLIVLHPEMGDDVSQYDYEETTHPMTKAVVKTLKRNNGNCVYLGESGCTIWDRAPAICRAFDCRRFYQILMRDLDRLGRRKLFKSKITGKDVIRAGKARVHTL